MASASLSLLLLASCSSGGPSSSGSVVPPVQAATYSNTSIMGTYSVMFIQGNGNGSDAIGSFSADGSGHITAGTIVFSDIGSTCTGTFTGTYTVSGSASGAASLTFVAPSCATYNYSSTDNYMIQVSGGGDTFFAQPSPSVGQSNNNFHIVASKQ